MRRNRPVRPLIVMLSVALVAVLPMQTAAAMTNGRVVGGVFDDVDGNGVKGASEPVLAGVTVTVTDSLGAVRVGATNANGRYNIVAFPGTASVDVEPLANYAITTGNAVQSVEVAAGTVVSAERVGEQVLASADVGSATGLAFDDTDGNGVADPGEPLLAGLTVQLVDSGGTTHATTTSALGTWDLIDVASGVADVTVNAPAGFVLTTANNPQSITVPIDAQVTAADVGFQVAATGTLTGHVFSDLDGNGVDDGSDTGVAGVEVEVTDSLGAILTTTTDTSGDYVFTGMAGGTASVTYSAPAGYTLTTANDLQAVAIPAPAEAVGYQLSTGTYRGFVFDDLDGSGSRSTGEPGIAGVAVTVIDSEGGVHPLTTIGSGAWRLNSIPVGPATSVVSTPTAYTLTTANESQSVVVPDGAVITGSRVGYSQMAGGTVYVDVAGVSGLVLGHDEGSLCSPRIGSGSAWADFDGDGDQDLYVTNRGGPSHMYRNEGDVDFDGVPDFVDVATNLGISFPAQAGLGAVFVDFDNDGDQDLYVTRWEGNTLLKNMLVETGVATFTDIGVSSGLADAGRAITASWGDYDNDGFLDLYLSKHRKCNEDEQPTDRLFHNDGGTGTFTDVTSAVLCGGADPVTACADVNGLGFTAGWLDYDRDGDLDLYVVNDNIGSAYEPNKMWQNGGSDGAGGWIFAEVGAETGTDFSLNGMGLGIGDYNNDGWLDLAFSHSGPAKLLLNDTANAANPEGAFIDVSAASGVTAATTTLTWGTAFLDYDNNQWLDLFFVASGAVPLDDPAPDFFLENDGFGNFTDIAPALGIDDVRTGRSASMADFDADGWVDVFIGNIGDAPALMQNRGDELGNDNHFLTVTVEGTESNRDGIGTQLWLTTPEGTQLRLISSGATHGGGDQKAAFFGLGTQTSGDLTIEWPNGVTQVIGSVSADQAVHYVEPSSTPP